MAKYINFMNEFQKDVEEELRMKQESNDTYMKLIRLMMHGQLKDSECRDDNKKGAVVAFSSKAAMKGKKAVILDNLQELVRMQPTHFTQGAYPSFKLKSDKKGVTWGFQKDNLNQINFLMVDFDDKSKTPDEIAQFAKAIGLHVNLIVRSDKGYQAYFIFREALYLNDKRHDWIIKSADMVADNVKKVFKDGGFNGVDEGCTNYQICRFPRRNKIEYVDINRVDDYDFYVQWSKKHSETARLPRMDGSHTAMRLIKSSLPAWARAMHGYADFQEGDRNTAAYTLALSYRDAEIPFEQALTEITNWMLPQGLDSAEIEHIVQSAYKGGHHASGDYFNPLIEKYNLDVQKIARIDWSRLTDAQKRRYWVHMKPAKPREQRQRSHMKEYVDDVIQMIEENEFKGTKTDLMLKLGLKRGNTRMVNKVLEELQIRQDVDIKTIGTGRQVQFIIQKKEIVDQTPEETPQQTEASREEELRKEVAISLIGSPGNREYARIRAVQTVGTKRYGELVAEFITDAVRFVGGEDKLNEIRNYSKKASG